MSYQGSSLQTLSRISNSSLSNVAVCKHSAVSAVQLRQCTRPPLQIFVMCMEIMYILSPWDHETPTRYPLMLFVTDIHTE